MLYKVEICGLSYFSYIYYNRFKYFLKHKRDKKANLFFNRYLNNCYPMAAVNFGKDVDSTTKASSHMEERIIAFQEDRDERGPEEITIEVSDEEISTEEPEVLSEEAETKEPSDSVSNNLTSSVRKLFDSCSEQSNEKTSLAPAPAPEERESFPKATASHHQPQYSQVLTGDATETSSTGKYTTLVIKRRPGKQENASSENLVEEKQSQFLSGSTYHQGGGKRKVSYTNGRERKEEGTKRDFNNGKSQGSRVKWVDEQDKSRESEWRDSGNLPLYCIEMSTNLHIISKSARGSSYLADVLKLQHFQNDHFFVQDCTYDTFIRKLNEETSKCSALLVKGSVLIAKIYSSKLDKNALTALYRQFSNFKKRPMVIKNAGRLDD